MLLSRLLAVTHSLSLCAPVFGWGNGRHMATRHVLRLPQSRLQIKQFPPCLGNCRTSFQPLPHRLQNNIRSRRLRWAIKPPIPIVPGKARRFHYLHASSGLQWIKQPQAREPAKPLVMRTKGSASLNRQCCQRRICHERAPRLRFGCRALQCCPVIGFTGSVAITRSSHARLAP